MQARWLLCLSLLLLVGPASAQTSSASVATATHHLTQGMALYRDGNFSGALAEFAASYQAQPAPGVLCRVGLAHRALFHYGEALDALRRCLAEARDLGPKRRAEIRREVAEIEALLVDVTLAIEPRGAAVVIDARSAGQAPLPVQRLAAGPHVISISAEGYHPLQKEVHVTTGSPLVLDLLLQALPRTGKLHLSVTPRQALVQVDDRTLGPAPVDAELPGGRHTIAVSAPGRRPYRGDLFITAGQSRSMDVSLDLLPGHGRLYKKWWFWMALGAIAAGSAIAVAVPLSARNIQPPISGTLSPGSERVN